MITVIAGIIMLGILVFVHEFGHFAVAKISGVKVLKFSLGFGPKLFSRQWGETEYLICAVPLGGYVQMLGEGIGENGEVTELPIEDQQRSFAHKPIWCRSAIVIAGPLMNLLVPFMVLPLAYMVGVNIPTFLEQPPCIGYLVADSAAEQAGFLPGDCIESINGDPVATWTESNHALINHVGSPLAFGVVRTGRLVPPLTMNPDGGALEGLQSIGILPHQEAIVGALAPGMPAQSAGMEVGDRIVAIAGMPISSWYDLKSIIQKGAGESQVFSLLRNGQPLQLSIQPNRDEANGSEYLIGIAPLQESEFKRFGFIDAVRSGAKRTAELIELTLVFVQKMVAGHVSAKNIGGPITVVQIAGQAAQTSLSSILTVLAFLSIQLGILNLLPIPILDGGHLFFNLYEAIFRRPLSIRAREIAQQVGLLVLIALMVLAFYNDIVRIFFGAQ